MASDRSTSDVSYPLRPGSAFAYVGCYTTEQRKARGNGINVYAVGGEGGAWRHLQLVDDLVNPSFLVLDRAGRRLYAVHGDLGYASAFAVDPSSGELKALNRGATGGLNGAHLALDPSGRWLITANYTSGCVSVLPVKPDGSLADHAQRLELQELCVSPNSASPARSHPHHVVFDPSSQFVLVPDKGLDRIFVFRIDAASGRLSLVSSIACRPGAGPRHLVFHPVLPLAWVVNELDSSVAAYRWNAAEPGLAPVQVLTTLPPGFSGPNLAAEIVVTPDGRFVYCSNRGSDTVAFFSVDAHSGALSPVGWQATQGREPRFITLGADGRSLLVANEQSDSIVHFQIDPKAGHLAPTGQLLHNASPSAIVFSVPTPPQ